MKAEGLPPVTLEADTMAGSMKLAEQADEDRAESESDSSRWFTVHIAQRSLRRTWYSELLGEAGRDLVRMGHLNPRGVLVCCVGFTLFLFFLFVEPLREPRSTCIKPHENKLQDAGKGPNQQRASPRRSHCRLL